MIKLIILDLNGTITNELFLLQELLRETFECYFLEVPDIEEYRVDKSNIFMDFYYQRGITRHFTLEMSSDIRTRILMDRIKEIEFQPGVLDLIIFAVEASIPLALVTAENRTLAQAILRQLRIEKGIFDNMFFSQWQKTDAFKELLEKYSLEPSEVVYIDDIPNGLIEANALGIKAFGVCNGFKCREVVETANPDFIGDTLYDVLQEIKNYC